MNQTSVPSFVVPVFPPEGTWKPDAQTLAAVLLASSHFSPTQWAMPAAQSRIAAWPLYPIVCGRGGNRRALVG